MPIIFDAFMVQYLVWLVLTKLRGLAIYVLLWLSTLAGRILLGP